MKERYTQYKIERSCGCTPIQALENIRMWEELGI